MGSSLPRLIYSLISFSDIHDIGVWKGAHSLADPELSERVTQLLDLILASNVPRTASKYTYSWCRWRRWARSKQGVVHMPAQPLHIALYLLELAEGAVQKGTGGSVIDAALTALVGATS